MENHSAKLAQDAQLDGSSAKITQAVHPLIDIERSTRNTAKVAWRSMASFDSSRKCLAVVGHPGMLDAIRIINPCADGEHWRSENGFLYGIEEIRAWAPIPEWTGEVTE